MNNMITKSFSIYILLLAFVFSSCSKNGVIGGDKNETNEVNMTTFDFLKSYDVTTETATLFEKAGLTNEINGDVTLIAPSNFAVNRYLRRKSNRLLRLDPNAPEFKLEDIPVADLEQLKMYNVDGQFLSTDLTPQGILLPTHHDGDSLRLSLQEATAEPGAAWDGGGEPGAGYQYSNFMQSRPKKVTVHFKRGSKWEMTGIERTSLGYDNPECDQVYKMYISDVKTTNGVVHVIYSGDYNYSDHYYYHTLFFFGTRADDLL
jgi:hypothetical protein